MELILIILTIWVLYSLRDVKGFGAIWRGMKAFLIVLGLTLSINYAKKSIKAWWNKD
jgi:chromate transport protein ChrA